MEIISDNKAKNKKELIIDLNKRNRLKKYKKDINENKITKEEYELRIREQYNSMKNIKNNDLYKWAEDEEDDKSTGNDQENLDLGGDLDNLLKTNKSIINEKKILSNTNILKIHQCQPVTKLPGYQHSSIMSTINFHPTKNNILLTSGLDKKLKIFDINFNDNYKSKLVNTINTLDIPIFSVKFISNEEIIITGKRKHYYLYNLDTQKLIRSDGNFATSSNKITSLEKCFVGNNIYSFGDNKGNIYRYDIVKKI